MMASERSVLVRFFRLGALLALVGSLHILALLLPWYVVSSDTVYTTTLSGYLLPETLLLSAVGGVLAGLALLATSFSSRAGTIRVTLVTLALLGGLLALASPVYLSFIVVPRLNVTGEPELGFFASLFSAIVLVVLGSLAALTRLQRVEAQYPADYRVFEIPYLQAPAEETSLERLESVDEDLICPICYTSVTAENAVRCTSCGVVFHEGCADSYVSINGTCPNCGLTVV